MERVRRYGNAPFSVAIIHGGPGAPGEMAPVARELCSVRGVLEPLQSSPSLEGQVRELREVVRENGELPVTLIGWSWGAMLSYIVAARYPGFVARLVLIGSAVYEEEYAADITQTRFGRLGEEERVEARLLMKALGDPGGKDKGRIMARLGDLLHGTDSYDSFHQRKSEVLEYQHDVYRNVWSEAMALRSSGRLLRFGTRIQCPVLAIHGDYDPHPWQGVKEPLTRVLRDFRFILLENCGHRPWLERAARDAFYRVLKNEIQ